MSSSTVHLAVFGDTHGHLRLMFQLCRLWQREHATRLDGILQCGDLGFFPNPTRLDKATKRFAERDPEEVGFAEYFALPTPLKRDPLLERILHGDPTELDTVGCPVLFCHGNHEDFELLQQVTAGAANSTVDCFHRLHFLRSGEVADLAGLRIAALGGAPEHEHQENVPVLSKQVSDIAARRLRKRDFEVLLSHGAPRSVGGESDYFGSVWLRELIDARQPSYNFFGHHRKPISPARAGRTRCFWLNDTNFEPTRHRRFEGPVEPGCMGVLRWEDSGNHEFKIIDEPWFRSVNGHSWRHF